MTRHVISPQQVAPGATTPTDLYTVPALTEFQMSTFTVCNRGSAETTWRMSVSVGGGATANKDYDYYDIPIAGNDTFKLTDGKTMKAGDIMRVYAGNANLSFNVCGAEIT